MLWFFTLLYNPPEPNTDTLEYIEIYNSGTNAVDLLGFTLYFGNPTPTMRDSISSSLVLNPGSILLFAANSSAVQSEYSLALAPRQWTGTGLTNAGTTILIKNGTLTVDSVRYTSTWEPRSNGLGTSLILCDVNSDNAISTNWDTSATNTGRIINNFPLKGSPGVLETCFVQKSLSLSLNPHQ